MSYAPHTGMQVVCIKKGAWSLTPGSHDTSAKDVFPLHGQVLTIRDVEEWLGKIYLRFVEITNPIPEGHIEASFLAKHFRPVQKRATDLSVFTALLNPSDHDKHLIEVFDFVSVQGDLQ